MYNITLLHYVNKIKNIKESISTSLAYPDCNAGTNLFCDECCSILYTLKDSSQLLVSIDSMCITLFAPLVTSRNFYRYTWCCYL